MAYPYKQVDVFSSKPFQGNPVAVFLEADHLATEEMQRISNWMNLSETTFVVKPTRPEADYKVRIFDPFHEMPFAGHPTLGTAHAVLENGLQPKQREYLVQECGVGLVKIYVEKEGKYFFELPNPKIDPIPKSDYPELAKLS